VNDAESALALKFIGEAEARHGRSGRQDAHAAALEDFCMGIINSTEFIYTN
jgi:hypothetical protein